MKEYKVIEESNGKITLAAISDKDIVEYIRSGFESDPERLMEAIELLRNGTDFQELPGNDTGKVGRNWHEYFPTYQEGWEVIADNNGIYPEDMSEFSKKIFSVKEYDYFNGNSWERVTEKWLTGVKLKGLVEVYREGRSGIRCVYRNRDEIHYTDIYGTWGNPCVYRF